MIETTIKTYCDRCGKKVRLCIKYRAHHVFRRKFVLKSEYDTMLDLCPSCYDSLEEWMKLGKAESEEV